MTISFYALHVKVWNELAKTHAARPAVSRVASCRGRGNLRLSLPKCRLAQRG